MVFYESPHRLSKTLTQFAEYFGADGSHDEMKQDFEQVRGDFESNTFVTAVLKLSLIHIYITCK